MKKLLLIILFASSLSSYASRLQVVFVPNFNINVNTVNELYWGIGTTTTDGTINTIITTHNVTQCFGTYYPPNSIIFMDYNGSNINALINDLLANPNVSKVQLCATSDPYSYTFADRLYIDLISSTNGNPIGTNANLDIVTSNAALNLIFDTYDVKVMNGSSLFYEIHFDGDIAQLLTELDNLNSVISNVNYVGVVMLNTTEFVNDRAKIFPNPFDTTFTIETQEAISNYTLYDTSGKQLIDTNSKSTLDGLSYQLNGGIYFLNLQFENGQQSNYKIVKK